jgi:hypothetical protein
MGRHRKDREQYEHETRYQLLFGCRLANGQVRRIYVLVLYAVRDLDLRVLSRWARM